jgi:hypothetical protein
MPVAPSPGKIPPRLTYAQFIKKRAVNPVRGRTTKDRYQSYLNAYTTQHGGPHGPTAHGRPNQPFAGPSYESLLRGVTIETPAQLEARANRMANQGVKAQQAIIREEAKRLRDEAMSRMEAQAAAGRAAAAQNAGLFGMVGGEYNAGAREIAGLGTNLSNQMVNTTEGALLAQNAGLSNIGAPDIAVGGPAGANTVAGAPQGAVSAYQFGNLPAEAITSAGAASQFGLAGMVSAQNLRATQEAGAGMRDSIREANSARASAMRELAAGRPAQAAQFLQALTEANANARDQAMALLAARQTFGLQNQANKRATASSRQDRATAIQNRQLAQKQAALLGRDVNIDLSRSVGHYVDNLGRPVKGPNGQTIKFKEQPAAPSSTASWTAPEKRAEMSRQMSYFLKDSYNARGKLVRTEQQALNFMVQQFPGTPRSVLKKYVRSLWPKKKTQGAAGGQEDGGFGTKPGSQ